MDILKQFSAKSLNLDQFTSFTREHAYAIAGGALAIGSFAAIKHWLYLKSLPPGPYGWPLVGSSSLLNEGLIPMLDKLRDDYGDIVSINLGRNTNWVILNSYDAVKEAYVDRKDDFMDRSVGKIWQTVNYKDELFASPFDELYRENRKFCTRALRAAGYGKDQLDQLLSAETEEIFHIFDKNVGKEFDPDIAFKRATTNIACGVVFGRRLSHGDPELDKFGEMVVEFFTGMMNAEMVQNTPYWLLCLFNKEGKELVDNAIKNTEILTSFMEKIVREHEATFDKENLRDFVDSALAHGMHKTRGYRQVAHICTTFMADGINTAVSMIMFTLMYLIHFPKHQERIRKEINKIIEETGRAISLQDRDKLPFAEAFVNEVLRIVTPTLTTVPNRPLQTTTLNNFLIPKKFDVLANIHGVHHDPNIFEDPNTFKPERFLADGKIKRVDAFFPFGIGRRKCMGEQMVRSEMFYFLVSIVNRYELQAPSPDMMPDLTPVDASLARGNLPFKMILKQT